MTGDIESVVHWFPFQFGSIVNCQHLDIFVFEFWPKTTILVDPSCGGGENTKLLSELSLSPQPVMPQQ